MAGPEQVPGPGVNLEPTTSSSAAASGSRSATTTTAPPVVSSEVIADAAVPQTDAQPDPAPEPEPAPKLELKTEPAPLYSKFCPTTPLQPGATLLLSRPLCQIPIISDDDPGVEMPKRCWECLQLVKEPLFCGKCRQEWYCSRDCRDAAWDTYHSPICKALPSLHYAFQSTGFTSAQAHASLLLLKLISSSFRQPEAVERIKLFAGMTVKEIRAGKVMGKKEPQPESHLPEELEMFFQLIPQPLKQMDRKIISVLHDKFPFIANAGLTDTETVFLLERFQANNHVLSDERLKPMGHAILPTISRHCNHSCTPFGVISTAWNPETKVTEVMVKLMKPMNTHEQLTIPYLDPILPLQDRQTFLQERYGFTCNCYVCKVQESIPPSVLAQSGTASPTKLSEMFDQYVKKRVDALRSTCPFASFSDFQVGKPLPKRSVPFLPSRVLMKAVPVDKLCCLKPDVVKELTAMFAEMVAEKRWDLAKRTGEHILVVYGIIYGWRHPLVGLHCMEIARVSLEQHKLKGVRPWSFPLIGSEEFSGFLQDAAIYTVWARDCLQTSTSMSGPPSILSNQSLKDEITEFEGLCRVQWDAQQEAVGKPFDARQTHLHEVGEILLGIERNRMGRDL